MNINWTDVKTFFINQNEVTKIQLNGTTLWQKSSGPTPGPDYTEPFYIENPNNSAITATIKKYPKSAPTLSIQYSSDKTTWTTLGNTSTGGLTISVPANSKMYFRCKTNYWYNNTYYNNFTASSSFNIGGNIMSLLYGYNFTGEETSLPSVSSTNYYSLGGIFKNSVNLIDASNLLLPATTLTQYCYGDMFSGCTQLTTPPVTLPATTLANYCYYYMFDGCSSLTTPPVLPATTLVQGCYNGMFYSCSSLTTAPELPATTLAQRCYYYMFYGCSRLNYIKCLATDISASNCTSNWVNGVSATGTFVKDPTMSSWTSGNNGIHSGWTVQDAS